VDQAPDKTPTQNVMCLPILNENEDILGVLEMVNKDSPFNDLDAQILKSLTHQIFQSLSNAELFQKTLSGKNVPNFMPHP
jgi:GAF domain-containing protein